MLSEVLNARGFAELWRPDVLAWLIVAEAAYLYAFARLGKVMDPARKGGAEPVYFSLGLFVLYLSEGTPLHILGENYLLSAHMLQHVVIAMVVAPLLLLGTPGWMARPLLRLGPLARASTRPVVAFFIFNLVYFIWHLPPVLELAWRYHTLHFIQHVTIMTTAVLAWWPILSPLPELPRLSDPGQLLYIALMTTAHMVLFGPFTISDRVLYPWYARAPRIGGLSALTDQQIAALLMNVGNLASLGLALTVVFFRWAAREEASDGRPDRLADPVVARAPLGQSGAPK